MLERLRAGLITVDGDPTRDISTHRPVRLVTGCVTIIDAGVTE